MSAAVKVIAGTLGLSYDTEREFIDEYAYQPTRTSRLIFTDGNDYYAVGKKPPKDEVGQPWQPHADQFWAQQYNTVIWRSIAQGEDK